MPTQKTFRPDPAPNRPNNWFMADCLRAFVNADLVQQLGALPFALLALLLSKEHGWHYSRLPHYSERQLAEALGYSPKNRTPVRNAIEVLRKAGWLERIEGGGNREGDWYRVVLPAWASPEPVFSGSFSDEKRTTSEPLEDRSKTTREPQENQPIYPTQSPPITHPKDVWAEVEGEMFRLGIQETKTPFASFREHGVSVELVLGVLRHASQLKAWNAGKIRRRLINLRPGQDPAGLWPTPDRQPVASVETRTRVNLDEERRQREASNRALDEKWRQLELQFGSEMDECQTLQELLQRIGANPLADRLRFIRPDAWKRRAAGDITFERGIALEAWELSRSN
ncbi:hypothetical protein Plim_2135 [Planctopirus limnophila DSM 3776]|uniref:Helix-turn-helix domain-containing protein n=2 Tax=Planctopirus limnophila TaxID=120 RepID=D5SMQ7_PLAL2|nr:hypothetical protein Plim_2135 [Planctopirus limnophila DSM 3776]